MLAVRAAGLPGRLLLGTGFDEGGIPLLRRTGALARRRGLADSRADDPVLGVGELMTNAVRHGAGRGQA
ncbi:MAG TPA: ATP-binding protein [Asanoa sp.]